MSELAKLMVEGGAVAILAVGCLALAAWVKKISADKDKIQEARIAEKEKRIEEAKEYAIAMTKAEMQGSANNAQMLRSVKGLEKITNILLKNAKEIS